jgi:hypothetical protein
MTVQSVAEVGVVNPSSEPSNTTAFEIAPITYTAVPIPLPPGEGTSGNAVAVNSSGLVAVQPWDSSYDPYLWTESGGIITLPPFKRPPGCLTSITINGMNDLGQVVGTDLSCNVFTGFLYSNGMTSNLPMQSALTINDSGQIVGFPQGNIWQGPVLFQGGQISFLAPPPDSNGFMLGFKINNSGQVIGSLGLGPGNGVCPNSTSYRTFSWVNGVITTELPLLPDMACGFSVDQNNFGTAVGWTSGPENQGFQEFGWIWKNGTMGPLPGIGEAINDNEDVLSGTGFFSNGNVYDLNALLTNPAIGTVVGLAIANNGLVAGTVRYSDGTIGPVLLTPNVSPQTLSSSAVPTTVSRQGYESGVGVEAAKAHTHASSENRGYWNGSRMITTPVTGVQPSTMLIGTADLQITVSGTNFVSGAIVYWNGTPLSTTFNSIASLVASVPVALVATAGYATITAINPGGDPSNGFVKSIGIMLRSLQRISMPTNWLISNGVGGHLLILNGAVRHFLSSP